MFGMLFLSEGAGDLVEPCTCCLSACSCTTGHAGREALYK
jgi:hypothetical protein